MTVTLRGIARCALWLGLYVLVVLFPVPWVMVAGPGGFAQHLGAALGLVALSILAVQFVLTARFPPLLPPFGADVLYAFHRGMALVALAFAVAHPLLMLGGEGTLAWLGALGPGGFPGAAAALAFYALVLLMALSAARRLVRLSYVAWRVLHGPLALAAVCLALVHAVASSWAARDPVTRAGLCVWTLAWVGLLGWTRLVRPSLVRRQPYKVTGLRPEHGGATTLVLDPEHHNGFRFRAGQFAWVTVGGSPSRGAERPIFFSGSAQRAPRLELTVKAEGEGAARFAAVRPGARVWVDGPVGATTLEAFPDADRYVFVAGGMGIAACMSMLRTLADRGDRRPHTLVYGSTAWDQAIFREELAELASRMDLKVVHVLEQPPLGWLGETGVVGQELLERHLPRSGRRVCFVCGPATLMDAAEAALSELGIPLEDIHAERLEWA